MGDQGGGDAGRDDPQPKVEVLDPVICKGAPGEADFKALDDLAATIARKHAEAGLS